MPGKPCATTKNFAGRFVRSVASRGEVRTYFESAAGRLGAAHFASESAARFACEPPRGRECPQSEIRQRRVAERSAGHFKSRRYALARHAAPLAARCNKTFARVVAGVLRGSGTVSGRRP